MTDVDPLEVLAELGEVRELLVEIRDALVQPFGEISDWRRVEWAAGGYDDLDLGGSWAGVLIINEAAGDAYVGFGPRGGTAQGRVLTIPQGGWLAPRYPCSLVSVGGPVGGAAVVAPLIHGVGRAAR